MTDTPQWCRALIVRPDGTHENATINPDADTIREIIGGWLEVVTLNGCHAYCDEEGKLKGKPVNPHATALALALGWLSRGDVLVGTVVFLGDGPAGQESHVPQDVVDRLVAAKTAVDRLVRMLREAQS